jgi:hypothetical protein
VEAAGWTERREHTARQDRSQTTKRAAVSRLCRLGRAPRRALVCPDCQDRLKELDEFIATMRLALQKEVN